MKSTTGLFVAVIQVGVASLISEPAQAADYCDSNEALIPAGVQIIKPPVLREIGNQEVAARIPGQDFVCQSMKFRLPSTCYVLLLWRVRHPMTSKRVIECLSTQ